MKVLVFVIISILGIIKIHAVTVPERADVSSEIAKAPQAALFNKEYKLVYFAKTDWFNAWLSCLSCGMKLASITSQEEQNIVVKLIEEHDITNSHVWIAGNDLATEGRFNWFTSGEIFRYTNWAPGEPNNYNSEHCVELNDIKNRMWNDRPCTYLNYYLCENTYECFNDSSVN